MGREDMMAWQASDVDGSAQRIVEWECQHTSATFPMWLSGGANPQLEVPLPPPCEATLSP